MKNRLAARVLSRVLETRGWTQGDLAHKAGIIYTTVSTHLSGQRSIRDEHLVGYLQALGQIERPMLLAAWLRDTLPVELIHDLFPISKVREGSGEELLSPEVLNWSPQLDQEQRSMLNWWGEKLVRDPELDEIFRGLSHKAGYPKQDDSLTIPVIVTDPAGITIYCNPAFTALCGYPLEKLRGRKPGEILQGPETERDVVDEFSDALFLRRPFAGILTNYDAEQRLYRVHIRCVPVFDPLGQLIQFRALEEKVA